MPIVTVEAEQRIARPSEVVQAQFADMRHHMQTRVHAALTFSDLQEDGPICRFTSSRRLFGMQQTDQVELETKPDGALVIRVVSGDNAGLQIHQRFEAQGPDSTLVRVRVDAPVEGWKRLLTPLIRAGLQRDTVTSLEEDRRDLEENGYGTR